MRTSGAFQDVYITAMGYCRGQRDGLPYNPVVRRENGEWMLESRLTPAPDADLEVTLDDFCAWWYDDDDDPMPDDDEVQVWVKILIREKEYT